MLCSFRTKCTYGSKGSCHPRMLWWVSMSMNPTLLYSVWDRSCHLHYSKWNSVITQVFWLDRFLFQGQIYWGSIICPRCYWNSLTDNEIIWSFRVGSNDWCQIGAWGKIFCFHQPWFLLPRFIIVSHCGLLFQATWLATVKLSKCQQQAFH